MLGPFFEIFGKKSQFEENQLSFYGDSNFDVQNESEHQVGKPVYFGSKLFY